VGIYTKRRVSKREVQFLHFGTPLALPFGSAGFEFSSC
jgi:hypothetical protein